MKMIDDYDRLFEAGLATVRMSYDSFEDVAFIRGTSKETVLEVSGGVEIVMWREAPATV